MNTEKKIIAPIVLKDAKIVATQKNFRGERKQFNDQGVRNFVVIIDPDKVDIPSLIEKGWNIKQGKPNPEDPDYEPPYFLRVKVRYFPAEDERSRMNPRITAVTRAGDLVIDEENVGDLDRDDIIKANMTITGRWSESPTYTGITAYLRKMYVRIWEDDEDDDLREGLFDD